jgi:hypothetical protein
MQRGAKEAARSHRTAAEWNKGARESAAVSRKDDEGAARHGLQPASTYRTTTGNVQSYELHDELVGVSNNRYAPTAYILSCRVPSSAFIFCFG